MFPECKGFSWLTITSIMPACCTTRPAIEGDLGAITEIYNEAILTTTGTFNTEPKTVADRRVWIESLKPGYPLVVAETGGRIVGCAVLKPWSDRGAYADTAEGRRT